MRRGRQRWRRSRDGSSPPDTSPGTATIRLQNVLARAVPSNVTALRLSGFDLAGQVRFGPQTKPKSPIIDFALVPVSVRRIQVEYLAGERVVGVGLRDVILVAGQVAVFADLEFTDVEARLTSLTIEPTSLSLAKGTSGQLTAVGHYDDGTVLNLSNSVVWTPSSPNVSVDPTGKVSALSPGSVQVQAAFGTRTAAATVQVTEATLTSLRFDPVRATIAAGTTGLFRLQGTFSDGSSQDLTADATLTVKDSAIARLTTPKGTAVALAPGQTVINASLAGQSAQAELTVTAATLSRIDVTPRPASLAKGTTVQFTATGVFSDGTSQNLTTGVVWSALAPATLAITPQGLAQGVAQGSTSVQARLGTVTGESNVTVTAATVTGLTLAPTFASLRTGQTVQIEVTASYTDQRAQTVTNDATFESNAEEIASVTSGLTSRGLVTAGAVGNTTIDVSFGGKTETFQVGVARPDRYGNFQTRQNFAGLRGDGTSKFVDLNNDGTVDVLAATDFGFCLVPGLAKGDFDWPLLLGPLRPNVGNLAVGDLDGDGITDFVGAGPSDHSSGNIYVGMGSGGTNFTIAQNGSVGSPVDGLALGDLNLDGALDLVVACPNLSGILVKLGAGDGTFGPAVVVPLGTGYRHIVTADFNRDGRVDVAAGGTGSMKVLIGDGIGGFTTVINLNAGAGAMAVKVADIDSDGSSDIVVHHVSPPRQILVFRGTGTGYFTDGVASTTLPFSTGLELADFNGDGHLDALTIVDLFLHDRGAIYLGDGQGSFSHHKDFVVAWGEMDFGAADVNGDGVMDVITRGSQSGAIGVTLGLGGGEFLAPVETVADVSLRLIEVADFNEDGIPDLAVGGPSSRDTVRLGLGNGAFGEPLALSSYGSSYALAVGDLDGDSHLDVIATSSGTDRLALYFGNGDGSFTAPIERYTLRRPEETKIADVNQDGRADLVMITSLDGVAVLLGTGNRELSPPTYVRITRGSSRQSLKLADMNGDSHLDLVIANSSWATVALGNGDGTFAPAVNYPASDTAQAIAVGDLDEDGDLDLALANFGITSLSVLLNDGRGVFGTAISLHVAEKTEDVDIVDLDLDGHLDVVGLMRSYGEASVHYGNGDGTFRPALRYGLGATPEKLRVADFNGDGAPDFVTPGGSLHNISVVINGIFPD